MENKKDYVSGPWVARNYDGELYLFDECPYLHVGKKKQIAYEGDEIGHDVWETCYKDGDEELKPFYSEVSFSNNNGHEYDLHLGTKINNDLFPFLKSNNGAYNLRTLDCWDKELSETHIINWAEKRKKQQEFEDRCKKREERTMQERAKHDISRMQPMSEETEMLETLVKFFNRFGV